VAFGVKRRVDTIDSKGSVRIGLKAKYRTGPDDTRMKGKAAKPGKK
jgi:hypothetical protein